MPLAIMLGAGGHASVLHHALQLAGVRLDGYVTDGQGAVSLLFQDMTNLGSDADVETRGSADVVLVNGVGSTGRPSARREIFERFRRSGFGFMTVVHPRAIVAPDVVLGEGAQVMAGAIIQTGVRIGANVIINTGAIVDHDCIVGDHTHIAPGVTLSGNVCVGEASHIGTGATVIQGICIAAHAVVGAGAVVIAGVAEGSVVTGVPARMRSPS